MGIVKKIFAFSIILYLTLACKKESFYNGSDALLHFSADTISFDTVFTSIGTATRRLTVYNPFDKTLKISRIALTGATNTNFILNINGQSTSSVSDVELNPNDSLLILIQFFMDPSGNNKPQLIKDSIVFEVNNNQQNVKLQAFAQDVHLIKTQTVGSQVWIADKPYLIYGNVTVDSLSTLTIEKGATLYFHRNANLRIKGTLIASGDMQHPISFKGDRLEQEYKDIPGQWGGITFSPGSKNNILDWLFIENGVSGIQIGAYNEVSMVDLALSNTIIRSMTYNCLLAYNAKINASNCVLANAYKYTCALLDGGDYTFSQCTLYNKSGSMPALYFSNYDTVSLVNKGIVSVKFYNSIIDGDSWSDEISMNIKEKGTEVLLFENCLLKSKTDSTDLVHFKNIVWNKNPHFVSTDSLDFELKPLSAAINKGNPDIGNLFPLDLKMNDRTLNNLPDIGAYEYIQKK